MKMLSFIKPRASNCCKGTNRKKMNQKAHIKLTKIANIYGAKLFQIKQSKYAKVVVMTKKPFPSINRYNSNQIPIIYNQSNNFEMIRRSNIAQSKEINW